MKFMLLIHHVEALDESERNGLLQESIQLANDRPSPEPAVFRRRAVGECVRHNQR
jgi:hypothetical protein